MVAWCHDGTVVSIVALCLWDQDLSLHHDFIGVEIKFSPRVAVTFPVDTPGPLSPKTCRG